MDEAKRKRLEELMHGMDENELEYISNFIPWPILMRQLNKDLSNMECFIDKMHASVKEYDKMKG